MQTFCRYIYVYIHISYIYIINIQPISFPRTSVPVFHLNIEKNTYLYLPKVGKAPLNGVLRNVLSIILPLNRWIL